MADESWMQNVSAEGSTYPNLVCYGREIPNTSLAFILWSFKVGFYLFFITLIDHKNALHLHGMISRGALFHCFLWIDKHTDHKNILCLHGLHLRELLNWLVLLLVNHTGYKDLFFFLSSYSVRVSLESFSLTSKKILSKGDCLYTIAMSASS